MTIRHGLIIPCGNFLFRYRNFLFPLVVLAIAVSTTPGTAVPGFIATPGGILIILAGQAVRAAVIGLDYIKRGGMDKKVAADTLVVTGIFAHCRNPLYTGNLLILCGLLIVYDNLWALLAGGLFFFLAYTAIVMTEENYLAAKFGNEYTEYCARAPRWSLRVQGLREALSGGRFNWRRVINKDYTAMTTWIITLVLLLAYREMQQRGAGSYTAVWMTATLTISAVLGLTYLIKRLKKSGWLA
jgi:protein-S-isoprenylcysteine O-methyltransferase Ste14